MAVASAGPYASLLLAPDRQPRQHPTTQVLTGRPTNSVKALKANYVSFNTGLHITSLSSLPYNQSTTRFTAIYRSTCASQHQQSRTDKDFADAKFYCPHALADGNQHIRIRQRRWSSPQQSYLYIVSVPSYIHTHTFSLSYLSRLIASRRPYGQT